MTPHNQPHDAVALASERDQLHAELDQLTGVQRAAAKLARTLTEHLADEPFRLADQLAGLLEGELEPDEIEETFRG
ncbi:hypothetical protein [Streptomyces sp. TRM49041]|uniref:hypothetical protein n=1 Tax=Streptomyces sp. TRM49041 TaxID=2603216 RepID=UPI0011EC2073|nr:hypothetical protein [Streptomyces sp. TRM49041]